jgi:transcriptional regulator with XRE-family HTH domain
VTLLNLREVLSENIRTFRAKEDLSQEEFAARSGLHRTYIGSVERLERNVTLETLQQLSTAMGISAAALLTPSRRKDPVS